MVIDYLQLVNAFDESKGWNAKERDIVFSLKNIVEKFNIPVVLVSQLSKSVDMREDKRPTIFDIDSTLRLNSNIIVSLYCGYRYTKLFNPDIDRKDLIDTDLFYLKNNNQLDNMRIIYDKSKCSFVID